MNYCGKLVPKLLAACTNFFFFGKLNMIYLVVMASY